ncbi:MAG TPA: phosphoenolpyruvate carboxykinase, partial [Xanthomonadales bacterium]|nr:phosphoenolpyruvate carboxykinase [Xanthomonadales bacterium]
MTSLTELQSWVDQVAALTRPDRIHWCNGSAEENAQLIQLQLASGALIELNQKTHPECYLHRSDPNDVARVEHLTFVCTAIKEDAGPNNNWMHPE